jgi:hypothetical protein
MKQAVADQSGSLYFSNTGSMRKLESQEARPGTKKTKK